MKRRKSFVFFLIFLNLLFLRYLLCETFGREEGGSILWQRKYGKPDKAEFAWDVAETKEGDFVLCGITIGKSLWDIDGLIMKINSKGDVLWEKEIGGRGQDFLFSLIIDREQKIVLTGSKYQIPFNRQVWFLKLDKEGNVLIDKTFGGRDEETGNQIIQAEDGGYLIIGDTKSYGSQKGGKDILLMKLDEKGKFIWKQTYDLGYQDMGKGIIPFGKNKYLIVAVSATANAGGFFQEGQAEYILIDSSGKILKTRVFREGKKNIFQHIAPTKEGGAIIVGATSKGEKFPSTDLWVVKLDGNGELEWERTYGKRGRYDGGFAIFQSNDGDYFLAGYTQSEQSSQMDYDNWWWMRLDEKGNSIWSRCWGAKLNDDAYAIIPNRDGGLLIAGWVDANSNPFLGLSIGDADIYVIKSGR